MIYSVLVMRGGAEKALADALAGVVEPRRVYVVGMNESDALAATLSGQQIMELDEPSAEELLRFTYSQYIGTEGEHGFHHDKLIELAKSRVNQLQTQHPSPLARAAA